MITLIHGDDLEKIEKEIILLSEKNHKRLDGLKIKKSIFEEEILGGSLFGDENIFLIENLFKNKSKKELFSMLKDFTNTEMIFIERKILTKRDITIFKFDKIREYILPQYYFKFLDEFYPRNKNLNLYLEKLLQTFESEQIFYSMIKRVRSLMAVKLNQTSHSEVVKISPWQMGKLKSQARLWRDDELQSFYKKLYEIELKMKSGGLPLPLKEYLDIAILAELN